MELRRPIDHLITLAQTISNVTKNFDILATIHGIPNVILELRNELLDTLASLSHIRSIFNSFHDQPALQYAVEGIVSATMKELGDDVMKLQMVISMFKGARKDRIPAIQRKLHGTQVLRKHLVLAVDLRDRIKGWRQHFLRVATLFDTQNNPTYQALSEFPSMAPSVIPSTILGPTSLQKDTGRWMTGKRPMTWVRTAGDGCKVNKAALELEDPRRLKERKAGSSQRLQMINLKESLLNVEKTVKPIEERLNRIESAQQSQQEAIISTLESVKGILEDINNTLRQQERGHRTSASLNEPRTKSQAEFLQSNLRQSPGSGQVLDRNGSELERKTRPEGPYGQGAGANPFFGASSLDQLLWPSLPRGIPEWVPAPEQSTTIMVSYQKGL